MGRLIALVYGLVRYAFFFVTFLLEERDPVDLFGDEYRRYRQRTSMLVPWRQSARPGSRVVR